MAAGQRFERTQTVDVLVCWAGCGFETPPYGACCTTGRPQKPRTGACGHCGVEVKSGSKFCSVACYGADKRKSVIVRVCPCGQSFDVPVYRLERGDGARGGLYCSPACRNAHRARKGAA